jgi:transposase-like protein
MLYVRLTDSEKVNIIKAYETDLIPMIELAKQHGVTRQCIHKLLRKAGVDTSKTGAANIEVSCTVCGTMFKKKRCQVRKAQHVFCSEACYFAWLKHGNGNPLIMHRNCSRIARSIVSKYFALRPGNIVHHEDRNQYNNELSNLRVFACQGDHIRYHRGFTVPILWNGLEK